MSCLPCGQQDSQAPEGGDSLCAGWTRYNVYMVTTDKNMTAQLGKVGR